MNHIIKKRNVRLEDAPGVATSAAHGCNGTNGVPDDRGGAQVELLRDGEIVRAIQVRCGCGETTVVELEYAHVPEPTPQTR